MRFEKWMNIVLHHINERLILLNSSDHKSHFIHMTNLHFRNLYTPSILAPGNNNHGQFFQVIILEQGMWHKRSTVSGVVTSYWALNGHLISVNVSCQSHLVNKQERKACPGWTWMPQFLLILTDSSISYWQLVHTSCHDQWQDKWRSRDWQI